VIRSTWARRGKGKKRRRSVEGLVENQKRETENSMLKGGEIWQWRRREREEEEEEDGEWRGSEGDLLFITRFGSMDD